MQAYVKIKLSGIVVLSISPSATPAQFNETDFLSKLNCMVAPSGFFNQQPTGFDQWSAMFQRFTVLASSIKCHIANTTTTSLAASSLLTLTVLPTTMTLVELRNAADAGGSLGTGVQCDLQNDAKAKTVMLGSGQACNTALLKNYVAMKDLYPQKDIESEDDFSGYTASQNGGPADPAIQAAWGVSLQSSLASANTTNNVSAQVQITVTMYTKFSSPVNVYDS